MDSWPPATTILLSPCAIAWAPSATVRRPEPQTMLMPQAGAAMGMPAAMEAWRAGFCPCAAVSTWPRMTSETSSPVTLARSRAALMATSPSLWAGRVAKAPLKDPTGVRAADTMTTSSMREPSVGGEMGYGAERKMPRTRALVNRREIMKPSQGLTDELRAYRVLRVLNGAGLARCRVMSLAANTPGWGGVYTASGNIGVGR